MLHSACFFFLFFFNDFFLMFVCVRQQCDSWVKAIMGVLCSVSQRSTTQTRAQISGWALKVRHGFSRKRWCQLIGRFVADKWVGDFATQCFFRTLYYSAFEAGQPLGALFLVGAEVACANADEESDDEGVANAGPDKYSLSIAATQGLWHFFVVSIHLTIF